MTHTPHRPGRRPPPDTPDQAPPPLAHLDIHDAIEAVVIITADDPPRATLEQLCSDEGKVRAAYDLGRASILQELRAEEHRRFQANRKG